MQSHFFISDIHLAADTIEIEKQKEKNILSFINHVAENGSSLYIAGDLFDFWFEYRSVIPKKHFTILHALRNLVDKGINVEFIMGNHDFWLDRFFPDQLGIPVHTDSTEKIIDGKRLFIAHGDGIAENDHGYRLLKKILRHPVNVKLYRLIHPNMGFALAEWCSKLSRKHRAFNEADADYIKFAQDKFKLNFDYVILGHTHRPMQKDENNFSYINLGDWISHYSYGELTGGKLILKYWPDQSQ